MQVTHARGIIRVRPGRALLADLIRRSVGRHPIKMERSRPPSVICKTQQRVHRKEKKVELYVPRWGRRARRKTPVRVPTAHGYGWWTRTRELVRVRASAARRAKT